MRLRAANEKHILLERIKEYKAGMARGLRDGNWLELFKCTENGS